MEFKVWDSLHKKWSTRAFFIGQDGKLYIWVKVSKSFSEARLRFKPVFSTGITDKNGVELFDGDDLYCPHENHTGTIFKENGIYITDAEGWGNRVLDDGDLFEKTGSKYKD